MNRKERRELQKQQNQDTPGDAEQVPQRTWMYQGEDDPPEPEEVPQHLRCPLCFNGQNRGVGKQYSAYPLKKTKYFRCDKCGHTWSAVIETVVTQINHRVPEDLSER